MIFKAYLFEGNFEKKNEENSDNLIREGILKYITSNMPEIDQEKLWEELDKTEIKRAEKGKPYLEVNDKKTLNEGLKENGRDEKDIRSEEEKKTDKKDIRSKLERIHFNLSHSAQMAVLMVGQAPCGIDLQIMEVKNHRAIAKKYYTENEREFCEKYGLEGFFRIWVHREAFGKLSGEGILSVMPDFVDDDGNLNIEVKSPIDDKLVFIKDVPISKGILMAFATYGEDDEIEFEV